MLTGVYFVGEQLAGYVTPFSRLLQAYIGIYAQGKALLMQMNRYNPQNRASRIELGLGASVSGQPTLPESYAVGIVSAGRESGPPPKHPCFRRPLMKTSAVLTCAALAGLALATLTIADEKPAAKAGSAAAFEGLRKLVGEWCQADKEGKDGKPAGPVATVFKLTANDSVLHETLFPGTGHEMVSVYHLDGSKSLMLAERGRTPRDVGPIASDVQLLASGLLVFVREGSLLGQRFDPAAARLRGEPFPVAPSVDYFFSTGGLLSTSSTRPYSLASIADK